MSISVIVDMLSELFFIIQCSLSITCSVVGLLIGLLIVTIFAFNRTCRTVNNLLICNTSTICMTYCINNIIVSIYGYREDWAFRQPVCSFRAYCGTASCICICYSYLIQAISRLFFTIFFKYKYLVTFRSHVYLVALNWILGVTISTGPFFLDKGFMFENESRLCTVTTHKLWSSVYIIGNGFLVPVLISTVIYGVIWYRAYRSSRRVVPSRSDTITSHMSTGRRDIKIVRNMIMIMAVFMSGGIPFLILVVWNIIQPNKPPPSALYLTSNTTISLAVALTVTVLMVLNHQMKAIALGYLSCRCRLLYRAAIVREQSLDIGGFTMVRKYMNNVKKT